jgi:CRP-like cAMP-binding protein/LysM repeat protein
VSDLSKVPFLAQLSAADLDDLARRMETRTYEAGDLIYAEGTPGDGLYYVESGAAVVLTGASCDGEIMAHLPAGSTFGETALISERLRSTAVRAASECTVMMLPKAAYQAFLAERPAAGRTVAQTLLLRPQRSARQIMNELLRPMPVFAKVNDDALLGIARKLQSNQVCANTTIFEQGQLLESFYIIESGAVRLEASGALLAEVGAHDFFGEDAMLTDEPSEMTAVAASAADLWSLGRDAFDSIVNAYPAAAIALTRALAARSEHLNRKLVALASAGAPAAAPLAPAPAVVAVPVPFIMPAPVAPKPAGPSLAARLTGLSLAGKAAVAATAVLLVWLLVVSIPSAIGSSAKIADQTREVAIAQSVRGASAARGLESIAMAAPTVDITDASSAPTGVLGDIVAIKTPAPTPSTPPATVAPTETTPPAAASYTVQGGDSMWGISSQFNIDMDVLAAANSMTSASVIKPGDTLSIPGGKEQSDIAARLAAAPKVVVQTAPALAPAPAAAAAPAVAAAPAAPSLPFVWDGRLDKLSIRVDPAAVQPGQQYYRLVKALFKDTNENVGNNMPAGDHNIYVEVLDENGKRLTGVKAGIQNGGLTYLTMENKPFPEYAANFPMYGMLGSYSTWIEGAPSDKVVGMGLPMKWHVTYYLTFQRATK